MKSRLQRWTRELFEPVDAASIAVFRIVLGLMIAWDVVRFLQFGWVAEYYITPKYHFTYLYFDWVKPWPGQGMYVHFVVMGIAALLVAAGLFYRPAIALLWLLYTYKFLLEESVYMNHYYLIGLLCFLLIFMQPQRAFSLDRRRHLEWSATVPWWNLLLLRAQLFIVYFFGAIAKLNPDWLRGEPMYSGLVNHAPDVPAIAYHFPPALLAYGIAYGGVAFDATVPILLCFRRTRLLGFVMATIFHLLNDAFLSIGVFSYLMTGAITLFFDPDWPRQLAARWRGGARRAAPRPRPHRAPLAPLTTGQRAIIGGMALYAAVQLLLPLRSFLYPGQVSWTEDGHRFSWHMKLRAKSGEMTIVGYDPATKRRFVIDPADDLRDRQMKKLYTFPDILLQYVHYKADELRSMGIAAPEIYVDWRCALNGAAPKPIVDTRVNLVREERSIWPARWIIREH
ncbi:MAG: HTTM domain-containing protein [bacterium]